MGNNTRIPTSPLTPPPALPPLRVMLVDDHPLFLEGLRNLLTSEGIQVVGTAQDGMEALVQSRRLRPDVIMMDIQMPRCDGVVATRLIKAEMPECKIVMLTMSEDEQDLFEAVKSGASGYLLKRLEATEFFRYLSELQAGHSPFSPGLAEKILKEFTRQTVKLEAKTKPLIPPTGQDGGLQCEEEPKPVLSPRQEQILILIAQGHTYRRVAETIGISERTVKYHMAEILERLHMKNRAQVIAYAARIGLTRET